MSGGDEKGYCEGCVIQVHGTEAWNCQDKYSILPMLLTPLHEYVDFPPGAEFSLLKILRIVFILVHFKY